MSLQPVLISEYSDMFEMLVVDIKLGKEKQVIGGYAPQGNISSELRMPFFATLEEEIVSAKMTNKSILIQMDANSKLGKEIIPNDPTEQRPNGSALAGIIQRNGLIVVNSLTQKCKGLITRKRITVDGTEESVIDFVIISTDLLNDVVELVIDEKKEYALSKIVKGGTSTKVIQSDHKVMLTKLNLEWSMKQKTDNEEIFDLKNKQCQLMFKEETPKSKTLSNIFDTDENIDKLTVRFLNGLKRCT